MNLKPYRYELFLSVLLVFAISAFLYKNIRHDTAISQNREMIKEIESLQRTADLKSMWGDKRIPQKLETIHALVSPTKLRWQKKGRKLTAVFSNLQPEELNRIISKLLSTPVQIDSLEINKNKDFYNMEIKCKW